VHRIGRTGRAGLTGEAISLVSPEDSEALAAIEKLINKKLDRVLVAGFQPSTGAVATMMGGASRGRGGREARGGREGRGSNRREGRPPHHQPQPNPQAQAKPLHSAPQHPRPQSKPSDPIFSKPYEPGSVSAEAKPQEPVATHGKRRERPVAALLGGLKRA